MIKNICSIYYHDRLFDSAVAFLSSSFFFRFFFIKTRAHTQQMLSMQTGLYRCDE